MRQRLRSWPLGAYFLSLLLGTSALAEEELATGSEYPTAQLIGWSQDEQRYAFRIYSHAELGDLDMETEEWHEANDKVQEYNASRQDADGFCKGYVDHQGKRFLGALKLVVLERDKTLVTLPIQDEPRCTDPEAAAARLGEAKKKLAELGIDTGRTGKDFALVSGKRVNVKPEKQPPYAVEYVNRVKDLGDEDGGVIRLRGTQELVVHRGGKKQKLYSRKVKRDYDRGMGGLTEEALTRIHVSPSGERVVVLGASRMGDGRSGFSASLRVAAVVGWPEAVIAKEQ